MMDFVNFCRLVVIAVASLVVIWTDGRTKRIPNWISVAVFGSGLTLGFISKGLHGITSALLAALIGLAVFLVFYLLGVMGGGDIKLMAAFGALLGAWRMAAFAGLLTAVAGGVMAVLYILFEFLSRKDSRLKSIPYGIAICIGSLAALLYKM